MCGSGFITAYGVGGNLFHVENGYGVNIYHVLSSYYPMLRVYHVVVLFLGNDAVTGVSTEGT